MSTTPNLEALRKLCSPAVSLDDWDSFETADKGDRTSPLSCSVTCPMSTSNEMNGHRDSFLTSINSLPNALKREDYFLFASLNLSR